jgi:hypothetical protein
MKPNGYTYNYQNKQKCQLCGKGKRTGGLHPYYQLFKYNEKKICRECAKMKRVI